MKVIYSVVTISKNILLSIAFLAKEPVENSEELQIPADLNFDDFTLTNLKNS